MTEARPHLVVRLPLAALLGLFAFAPCYIASWTIVQIAGAPLNTPVDALVALAVCIPLAFFLLLLAYRAITWRGRGSDGGLLPPFGMFAFAALFALVGAAGLVLTLWRSEFFRSLLALGYLAAAIPVARLYWRRLRGIDRPSELENSSQAVERR